MNLNIQKHLHCKNSEISNHVGTKMDLDIDCCCSPALNNASPILQEDQMSQCAIGDSNGEMSHSPSPLLNVRQLYSMFNRSVDYLVISYNDMVASRLSSFKLHNSLQEGMLTTSRPVSILRSSPLIPNMTLIVLILSLAFSFSQAQARSRGLCRGVPCANGGRLMVDNSVWGHCRCMCLSGFLGPYCQYPVLEKRSVSTVRGVRRRHTRSQRLEQIKQRLLNLTPNGISSSDFQQGRFDSVMTSAGIMDNSGVISNILEAQNSIDDSYKHDSLSDRLWLLKNTKT